ncbi:MAG: helix-turn-helix transcriptional regulator [Gammaproteobacteria bacterium]|nr:helix-turn-helix transcriptional regulator [Gammaproteobacteria bacterium]
MPRSLIGPEELPRWVPGKTLLASDGFGWRGVTMRSYRYTGLDVHVPAMRDYMIVAYRHGLTPMARQFDGHWTHEHCVPGDVSLLTRAERSHWHWTDDIDVIHLYLSPQMLAKVSSEVMDRDVVDVRLRDVLKVHDPVIASAATAIAEESMQQDMGGQLYVEAVATQMSVHLLRKYSSMSYRQPRNSCGLSARQARQVAEYIESRLETPLTLAEMAALVGISTWHFLRQFRARFGCAPHAYVIQRRIEHARCLLLRGVLPIKEVAAACGFSDQAHMTRQFRRHLGITPAAVRSSTLR